ncbi:MAG: ribonuclease III [Hydrotalea sp.]|nr:ribonuclease III [Hydrotalea sp.]
MKDKVFLELINLAIGIDFNIDHEPLLRQAFTHPSAKHEGNYERLEFLGDRVLGLVMARWLYELYPEQKEGFLSIASARMVSTDTLYSVASKLGLAALLETKIPNKLGERAIESAMVNSLEAFLAALYISKGMEVVESFVRKHWQEFLVEAEGTINNPRGQLQEWLQARKLPPPSYKLLSTGGSDHEPTFAVELETGVPSVGVITATAKTKKLAMSKAATQAMTIIKKLDL